MSYVVVFRLGGQDNFTWQRSVEMDREAAERASASVRRGGRPAHVVRAALSVSVGLPDTFEPEPARFVS